MISPSTRSPRNSSRSFDAAPTLAWDSARLRSWRSLKRWPSRSSSVAKSNLVDDLADPAVTDGEGPFPGFPEVRAAIGGEKDDFRFAYKILERNIAHVGAAVGGIVAIVAHHEIMALGHDEHLG